MSKPIPLDTIEYERYVDALRRSNIELLEALRNLHDACEFWEDQSDPVLLLARAAINKASTGTAALPASKNITIRIEGGLVQDLTGIPAGYELRVEDYDMGDTGDDSWDAEKKCVVTVYVGDSA